MILFPNRSITYKSHANHHGFTIFHLRKTGAGAAEVVLLSGARATAERWPGDLERPREDPGGYPGGALRDAETCEMGIVYSVY